MPKIIVRHIGNIFDDVLVYGLFINDGHVYMRLPDAINDQRCAVRLEDREVTHSFMYNSHVRIVREVTVE